MNALTIYELYHRIRNIETNKCLVISNTNNSDRILFGDHDNTNHSGWYIEDNELISFSNKNVYMLPME